MGASRKCKPGEASGETLQTLAQLITDSTAALTRLDVNTLEQIQGRALEFETQVSERTAVLKRDQDAAEKLAACRRIFAGLLKSTGEHVKLLERIGQDEREGSWDR